MATKKTKPKSTARSHKSTPLVHRNILSNRWLVVASAVAVIMVGFLLYKSFAATSRDITEQPFSRWSPYNMPLGSGARFAEALPKSSSYVNSSCFSITIFKAVTTDPNIVVNTGTDGNQTIKAPKGADVAGRKCGDYDAAMSIIQPDNTHAAEMYRFGTSSSGYTSDTFNLTDLTGSGVEQGWLRASGASYLGGLIRKSDLAKGSINHALAMAIPEGELHMGPMWPADREDGNANTTFSGNIHYGTYYALPANVPINSLGLSPDGLMVAKALQDYGAYVMDRAENTVIYAEPSLDGQLSNMRNDWDKLYTQLQRVSNSCPKATSNCNSTGIAGGIGGGGNPRVCYAAPVGNDANITNPNGGVTEPSGCSGAGGVTPTTTVTPVVTNTPTPTVTPVKTPTPTVSPVPPTTTVTPTPPPSGSNLLTTIGAKVTASSSLPYFDISKVLDGDTTSNLGRWGSNLTDPAIVTVDLKANYKLSSFSIVWAADTTKNFHVDSSKDGTNWTPVLANGVTNGQLYQTTNIYPSGSLRYIRITMTSRWNNTFAHSIRELIAQGTLDTTPSTPSPTPTTWWSGFKN